MKLIVAMVVDVDSEEEAASEYETMDENWTVVSAKLDGKDFHPALIEKKKKEGEE